MVVLFLYDWDELAVLVCFLFYVCDLCCLCAHEQGIDMRVECWKGETIDFFLEK